MPIISDFSDFKVLQKFCLKRERREGEFKQFPSSRDHAPTRDLLVSDHSVFKSE